MRTAILMSILLIVAMTACNKVPDRTETAGGANAPAAAGSGGQEGPSTVNANDLLLEGDKPVDEVEKPMNTVPTDWMAEVPVYENGKVVFGESHSDSNGPAMALMIETTDSVTAAGDYYAKVFADKGYRRLDTRVGPEFVNNTWLINGSLVDVAIRQVPDAMGKLEIRAPDAPPVFEGSLIHIQIMPALDISHLTGSISWYGLDDVPEGFPLDMIPRYPGAEVVHATCGGADTVLQQVCDDKSIAPAVKFYSEQFGSQGREKAVITEEPNTFTATFTNETNVAHLNVLQNTTGDMRVSIDIYLSDK